MRILYFGTYSVGPGYPRNTVLIDSLKAVGVDVDECHVPLFDGPSAKIAAVTSAWGRARWGLRAVAAWVRLAVGYFRARKPDAVVVGYTGHLDIFLARALGLLRRRPIVLDAFLSPYDTVVGDRKLLSEGGFAARLLKTFERASLRLADRVLTDTEAGADYLVETFGLKRARLAAMPVGSLVTKPLRARVPVTAGAGEKPPPFAAIFVGSFVPLQGVPYILDAAAQAPEIRFRIVGDGPDGPRVEEEVKRRNMANVELHRRFVPRDEVDSMLAEAGAVLGVFGATSKAARVVPCKVYDGLAAGLPVVTGDSPAARELLDDGANALLVDREDPSSLVEALRRLRDDENLGETLRAGASRLARERFGREALGMRFRGVLQEMETR